MELQRALTGTSLVRDDDAPRAASLTASSHLGTPRLLPCPPLRKATHAQILLRRPDRCNDCGCHRAGIGPTAANTPGRGGAAIRLGAIDGTHRRVLLFRKPQERRYRH